MSIRPSATDWRVAASYSALARCDRHGFAWEWLRRSQAYRSAFESALDSMDDVRDVRRFGLHRFEPPDVPWPSARAIWCGDTDATVLKAVVASSRGLCSIDPKSLNTESNCVVDEEGEHWLLADSGRHVRIDVIDGSLNQGPAGVCFHITGYPRCHGQLAALQRLVALAELGRWPARNPPPERRAGRWALILRVHDAMTAGASHREIAECLFGLGDLPRWRVSASSWRRRVQRLAEAARHVAASDPRIWLSASAPRF